jgi:hypothetical protein
MSENILFDEKKIPGYSQFESPKKAPLLTRWAIQFGIAKDEKDAEKKLIISAIVVMCISGVLMVRAGQDPEIKHVPIKSPHIQTYETQQ